MSNLTTVEADPKGAASFLRALKQNKEVEYKPRRDDEPDWFSRGTQEVQAKLGRGSLWDNPSPVGIGWDYERLAGVNIGSTHPVIDDVVVGENIVTSMKTMNTHAYDYQEASGITHRACGYVDDFKEFKGVNTSQLKIPLDQIRGMNLEIAVRPDLTPVQREAFRAAQQYGQEKGIRVIICEVA